MIKYSETQFGSYITLPGFYKYGGRPKSSKEENTVLQTGNGRKFIYNHFTQEVKELIFHIKGETDLAVHRTLHDFTAGEAFPFWLSMSGSGSGDAILVWKQAGFDPRELERVKGGDTLYELIYLIETYLP